MLRCQRDCMIMTTLVTLSVMACASYPSCKENTKTGSALTEKTAAKTTAAIRIPFEYIAHALVVVKVRVNGALDAKFMIDTGAGITVISQHLCDKLGCETAGSFTGERMTGASVTLPLSSLESINLGDYVKHDVKVGVTDLFSKLPKALGPIHGALSLQFFRTQPFTIVYMSKNKKKDKSSDDSEFIILETPESLKARAAAGAAITLTPETHGGEALDIFADFKLSDDHIGSCEIDTGNTFTVIPIKDAKKLEIDLSSEGVKKITTPNKQMTRYYTRLPKIVPAQAPEAAQATPTVCFEEIIHPCVIGNDFLQQFTVTFDLQGNRLYLSAP